MEHVVVPHVLRDHGAGEHETGIAHEVLQDREFPGGEHDALAAAGYVMACRIERKIADSEDRSPRRFDGATGERAQTCEKLLHGEGLDEVVIGAGVKAGHAVVDRVPGGEHQDRRPHSPLAQLAADRYAIHLGKQDVEHDSIVLGHSGPPQCLRAGESRVNGVAGFLQPPTYVRGDLPFVFDKKNTHRGITR